MDCDNNDIFQFNGKRKIPSCPECAYPMILDDLLEIYPDQRI